MQDEIYINQMPRLSKKGENLDLTDTNVNMPVKGKQFNFLKYLPIIVNTSLVIYIIIIMFKVSKAVGIQSIYIAFIPVVILVCIFAIIMSILFKFVSRWDDQNNEEGNSNAK